MRPFIFSSYISERRCDALLSDGPLALSVNIRSCWETFQNWNSEVQRDVPARGAHALSLKGNSVTGRVFTRELNYLYLSTYFSLCL